MPYRSVGDNGAISSTLLGACAAYFVTILLSLSLSTPASALQTVPGSPCGSICSEGDLNYANDTVCVDDDYKTGVGKQFKDCTTCLLNSTAVDTSSNVSDVYWGLFNLRYTLSECMFAYPAEIVSISSPCQVLCQPLANSTAYGIGHDVHTATDNVVPNLDFCNNGFGGDNIINNCSFCYTMVPQQLFTSNFLQALHIACRQPPAMGQTFYPDGRAIFNESAIPGPGPPGSNNGARPGLAGWQLGLVIALPVVGGALLFGAGCFCCFKFTKKRRVRMAETGRMSTYHDRHPVAGPVSALNSPVTTRVPPSQYEWPIARMEPAQEMERIVHVHTPKGGKNPSPGLAQGRWSHQMDDDEDEAPVSALPRDDVGPGRGQSKDHFLHEQYFGVASSGPSEQNAAGPSMFTHPNQQGSWGR